MHASGLCRGTALLLLLCGLAGPASSAAPQAAAPQNAAAEGQGAIISGGIGEESREQLASRARDYNLKMVFVLVAGNYLSDVNVQITDARGGTVAQHLSQGPWAYARLPAGTYTVKASIGDETQSRKVQVTGRGQKVEYFRFRLPGEYAEGGSPPPR